jgi:predicted transposase YdaD
VHAVARDTYKYNTYKYNTYKYKYIINKEANKCSCLIRKKERKKERKKKEGRQEGRKEGRRCNP